MFHKTLLGLCTVAIALAVACSQSSPGPLSPSGSTGGTATAADGSTLKIGAPAIVSPTNNVQIAPNAPATLIFQNVSGTYASFPATYEVEVRNAAGALIANPKGIAAGGGGTTQTSVAGLAASTTYTWRVRATYASGSASGEGPWSATATFKSAPAAFISGSSVFDPLTTGFTVGQVVGPGHFIPGQGWQADSLGSGINYDISTCSSCQVEFDVTGVGNGLGNPADLKWITMADADSFGDFTAFRDGPWKMTLEERGDGDGTGMKLIWRNGCGNCGEGEPGDHTGKLASSVNWKDSNVYHFLLRWTPSGFSVQVDGQEWFSDGFGGNPYSPPHHRISLGCYPRNETLKGAIFRNVQIKPI
jgi:hypothetical protein